MMRFPSIVSNEYKNEWMSNLIIDRIVALSKAFPNEEMWFCSETNETEHSKYIYKFL